jgi:hypothetical protein
MYSVWRAHSSLYNILSWSVFEKCLYGLENKFGELLNRRYIWDFQTLIMPWCFKLRAYNSVTNDESFLLHPGMSIVKYEILTAMILSLGCAVVFFSRQASILHLLLGKRDSLATSQEDSNLQASPSSHLKICNSELIYPDYFFNWMTKQYHKNTLWPFPFWAFIIHYSQSTQHPLCLWNFEVGYLVFLVHIRDARGLNLERDFRFPSYNQLANNDPIWDCMRGSLFPQRTPFESFCILPGYCCTILQSSSSKPSSGKGLSIFKRIQQLYGSNRR